ncbi:MAG: heavy-metal-associated domain-containing protein [Chloroflexota bacterium]|nr:MAG: heavy-metal-associated domain-containing protein [Chloroflexota bacterium]
MAPARCRARLADRRCLARRVGLPPRGAARCGGVRRPDRSDGARRGCRRRVQPLRLRPARAVRDVHPHPRQRRHGGGDAYPKGPPAPARGRVAVRGSGARHVLHHRAGPAQLPGLARTRPPRRPRRLHPGPAHGPLDAQGRLPAGRGSVDDRALRHPWPNAEGDGARRPGRHAPGRGPGRNLHRALLGRHVPPDHRGPARLGERPRRHRPPGPLQHRLHRPAARSPARGEQPPRPGPDGALEPLELAVDQGRAGHRRDRDELQPVGLDVSATPPSTETIRFPVSGITCGSCVNRITRAVRKLDGVSRVVVDLRRETATVSREPALVSNAALAAAVAEAGYAADLSTAMTVSPDEARGLLARLVARLPGASHPRGL